MPRQNDAELRTLQAAFPEAQAVALQVMAKLLRVRHAPDIRAGAMEAIQQVVDRREGTDEAVVHQQDTRRPTDGRQQVEGGRPRPEVIPEVGSPQDGHSGRPTIDPVQRCVALRGADQDGEVAGLDQRLGEHSW